MPLVHLGFTFLWNMPWTLSNSLINAGIRMAGLVAFAVLFDRITRQARELRVLHGLLPVYEPNHFGLPHFQFLISGRSWPYLSMYCLCSISLSLSCCFR
jgi:hypothetical protein